MNIIREGYRVAYKDHKCDYSGLLIPKNQRYYYIDAEVNNLIINAKLSILCINNIEKQNLALINKSRSLYEVY